MMRVLTLLLVLVTAGVAYASGDAGAAGPSIFSKDFLFRLINFGILFGGLGYVLAKPLKNFLQNRRQTIESAIMEARNAKIDAEKKAKYYDEKLASLESEVAKMAEAYKKEAEEERQRIIKDSAEQIEKLKERLVKSLEQEKIRLRQEVMVQAANMAVTIAEEMVRKNFTPADQKKLVQDYISMMEKIH